MVFVGQNVTVTLISNPLIITSITAIANFN